MNFGACPGGPSNIDDENVELCNCDVGDCDPLESFCIHTSNCDPAVYATPEVEIAPLADVSDQLVQSLNDQVLEELTPMAPALQGAISHTRQWVEDHPEHAAIVVLATDGFPTECLGPSVATVEDTFQEVAGFAEAGYLGTPSIETFVIGVFAPDEAAFAETSLGVIAQAGGTQEAFIVETSSNVGEEFLAALETIRLAAIPCDFEIPEPDSGEVNFGEVNVEFSSGGSDPTTLFYVASPGDCDADGGWHYDVDPDAGTPTRITVCPASCDAFKETRGTISIELGCQTVIKPVK